MLLTAKEVTHTRSLSLTHTHMHVIPFKHKILKCSVGWHIFMTFDFYANNTCALPSKICFVTYHVLKWESIWVCVCSLVCVRELANILILLSLRQVLTDYCVVIRHVKEMWLTNISITSMTTITTNIVVSLSFFFLRRYTRFKMCCILLGSIMWQNLMLHKYKS